MKNLIVFFLAGFLFVSGFAQKNNQSETYFYFSKYYAPDMGAYLEFYFTTLGRSVKYMPIADNKWQASVDFLLLFKQNGEIKQFRKYNLLSPVVADSTQKPNFMDVQRVFLDTGSYETILTIKDKNNSLDLGVTFSTTINMDMDTSQVVFSGIEYVDHYKKVVADDSSAMVKGDYNIFPYVSNYFSENMENLQFYLEIYNLQKVLGDSTGYLLKYYLENSNSYSALSKYAYYGRKETKPVEVLFPKINISSLPSGDYNIVVEVVDKEGAIKGKQKYHFVRSNPKVDEKLLDTIPQTDVSKSFVAAMNIDSLSLFIKYLYPISTQQELSYARQQMKIKNLSYMQSFFLSFWMKRNIDAPQKEWEKYKLQIKIVNDNYSYSRRKGYQTERGRVFLKYGRPDDIITSYYEPSAYPYEIWHYYHTIENQNNVKFVFYNSNLVGEDFDLLHSTAKGEIYTNNWVRILHKRDTPIYDFYNEKYDDYYGDKVQDYY
ncbi:MAG: GWxTD domain-containing protein [Bacteroidales bacterium]|nr:GWxTD domain-containing protein [Bacteroidales bacterium]